MRKSTKNEDSIKKKNEVNKRWIVFVIFVLLMIVFLFRVITEMSKEEKESEKKIEEEEVSYSEENIEEVLEDVIYKGGDKTIREEDNTGDGEMEYSTSELTINNLNQEVLGFINNQSEDMEKSIRSWMNGYGFSEMQSVTFYGECLMDYNKNTIMLSFTIDTDESPGFDVVYNRTDKTFSVIAW